MPKNTEDTLIRSTKTSLRDTNTGRINSLSVFIAEYKIVAQFFVDLFWTMEKVPAKTPKSITSLANTWLAARATQCAANQASGIIRSLRSRQKKRLFIIKQLTKEGKHKKARDLQKYHDEAKVSKPDLKNVNPELNANCAKVFFGEDTSFDGWIVLSSLAKKNSEHKGMEILLPFRKHKHFNEMEKRGTRKNSVSVNPKYVKFIFKLHEPEKVTEGITVGVDVGQITAITCSTGQVIAVDNHGHTYQSICEKMCRKEKGTKAFERSVAHRTNFVNWSVNQLNLGGVKQVNVEDMKYYKFGHSTSRSLSHWSSSELLAKLKSNATESGVRIVELDPTYTSQRCSECGWVCKENRKKKKFVCVKCGFAADADKNGSLNISLPLVVLPLNERFRKRNVKGFYWRLEKQEQSSGVISGGKPNKAI